MPGTVTTRLPLEKKVALLAQHKVSIRAFAREIGKSHVHVLMVLRGERTSPAVMAALDAKVAVLLQADRRKSKKGKK